ncbi:MAG: hypothetical protein NTW11_01495 [Candidatus Staskawiczbacteria bacterium]|nr:hypothetical protein [Candidatus Staskawiczbacteria bacterium]
MNTFPILETFWDEEEGLINTDKILGYKVLGADGKVLGTGETPSEAQEEAYNKLYPPESKANIPAPKSTKRRPKALASKV